MTTSTIAAAWIVAACVALVVVFSEISDILRRRRLNAITYMQYCDEIIDKEMQR